MPDPVITLHQERQNLPGGTYRVVSTVTAATGISDALFVYRKEGGVFSHVATLTDLAYPAVMDPDQDWYRQNTATREFPDVTTALEFANHVKFRLDELMKAYIASDYAAFPGTSETTHPTP